MTPETGRRPLLHYVGITLAACLLTVPGIAAPDLAKQVGEREASGDLAGARSLLQQAGQTPEALEQTALFLDRHGDPMRRDAFLKWAASDSTHRQLALKQAVLLDLEENRRSDLEADLKQYRDAGGSDLHLGALKAQRRPYSTVEIPGPLSGFARMAALSPELPPDDLLPSLARNLTTNGFEAGGNETLQPTEYLRLLTRYIAQARELQGMGNHERKIVVPACDSEQTGALLKVLGYRMRGACGSDLVLETVNPTRAFLTIDSGFPLTELEQDLRANHRFEIPYGPTTVPVLYDARYWMSAASNQNGRDFLDAFTADPSLCRLYLGLSHVDYSVAEVLRNQMPPSRLRLFGNVLDFYGSLLAIDNGAVVTPGPAKTWASLTGASPANPGPFIEKLLTTDDGWLMSYYDALMRMNKGPVYSYLTQPDRLRRFYDALRGKITTPGPARPVFRSSTDLMLFTTSLYADPNGELHLPGNIEVWKDLFQKHPHGKYDGKLTRAAASWRTRDDAFEAFFALSRKNADNEPLHIFLVLNDIDHARSAPLKPELVARLISDYKTYGSQYEFIASSPTLSEESIRALLDVYAATARDAAAHVDRLASVQALTELWRILAREGAIPRSEQNRAFQKLLAPWPEATTELAVFDAARQGLTTLLAAVHPQPSGATLQQKWVNLLAGRVRVDENTPPSPGALFVKYFDAQQLIPLDALFAAADQAPKGKIDSSVKRVFDERLQRLEESTAMHDAMSRDEKSSLMLGYATERHIESERKFSFDSYLQNKKDVRTGLAPFLRDTLVGMLYCFYAPAGSEILATNPMFVRLHDFVGIPGAPQVWRNTEVASMGWSVNSGGRLAGSLVHLPYALAQAEQNFLMPKKDQALIWGDMAPQLIVNVTSTNWRQATPLQIRWVALHLRRGANLIAAASLNAETEAAVMRSLSRYLTPSGLERLRDQISSGQVALGLSELPPSFLYSLAADPKLQRVSPDTASIEMDALAASGSPELDPEAIARTFGTPKPSLTHSMTPSLMYLRTFPTLMGYSSRLMAESWESNNLFYAALADQAGVPVEDLDLYLPEWNRSAIENIFATHLEDWPSLIRSLNTTAGSVLHRNNQQASSVATSGN